MYDTRSLVNGAVPGGVTRPTLILFGLGPLLTRECQRAATAVHVRCSEVRHLKAACEALATHQPALLVASAGLKSWDRAVVEEHGAWAGASMRWISDTEVDGIGEKIEEWATGAKRRPRPR